MKCSECGFDNKAGKKFCTECGAKLELKCPQCNSGVDVGEKFCGECGLKLTGDPPVATARDESLEDKIDRIQRYLPEGLTERILSQKHKIEGERKQVTVMFCDMEGFTRLSVKLGPEEAYGIMDQVYEILIHKVHDYEGTVNEMTGDGIMALFGAPIALEDAPQRAIRSAFAIHREIAKFNDKLKKEGRDITPIRMRTGIHTGPVVVGTLGNNLRVEFKAVGDTVNLASRMEGLAEPGTSYVTEETFKLTEGLFRFEALGPREVKGKEHPVDVYRVIAPSSRRTRFDVAAERGLTPFVGRERDLEVLLDGLERAKSGRGQAFSIMAEAGLGKSRILYEFRKALANEDLTFLEGRCLSYSRGVAYHPITDILRANFDIQDGDAVPVIKEKVSKGLKALRADDDLTLPYILELLSVKESGIEKTLMSPETRKDRTIDAVKRIVLNGAEIRPLILAYEDLHWADKNSEDVLKHVLESIAGARVLMIFTYRPEFVHTWGGKSFHSQITLNRLSNRESLAMVSHLLGAEEIDSRFEDLVLEKTEGVPFFIEEFIKSLKELNLIQRVGDVYQLAGDSHEVTIPSTIQDVIMARVDSLPDPAKEVLQTGSAIEREFSYELLRRVTGLAEQDLLSRLSVSKDSELCYERGIYPQSAYVFRHALTQDVVYNSILSKRKKKLHEKIANAIEDLHGDNLDSHYGVLAEHSILGEDYEKGAKYSQLAGKRAQRAASFGEAIGYAEKAIFCLERLPATDANQRRIIDARTRLAGYHMSLTHHVEAKEAVAPIVDLAVKLDYQKRLPMIYTAMGTYNQWVEQDHSEAVKYLNEAARIATEAKDNVSLWYANFFLGFSMSFNCDFPQGLGYLSKSLDLAVKAENPIQIAMTKASISSFNYVFCGKNDLAYRESKEALRMAEESGDLYIKGVTSSSHGMSCYCKGLFDEAEGALLQALSFCEKASQLGWWTWAAGFLAHVYFDMGDYQKAQIYYEKAISALECARIYPFWAKMWRISMVRTARKDKGRTKAQKELFDLYGDIKVKVAEGWAARHVAEVLLDGDEASLADANHWAEKAIDADRRNETRWSLGCDYDLCGELSLRQGDRTKAIENMNKAIEVFKECGADGWLEKTEKRLAAIS